MNQTDKAIQGAALAALSKEQKRQLVLLAYRAYAAVKRRSFTEGNEGNKEESFDEWRHRQQRQAVERSSLRTCTNEDYLFLKAHYLKILGQKAMAEKYLVTASTEPRRWALARLEKECAAAKDVLPGAWNYAAGFLRNARHVSIDDATEKQIWHAIYIVRRRAAQLRRGKRKFTEGNEGNKEDESAIGNQKSEISSGGGFYVKTAS